MNKFFRFFVVTAVALTVFASCSNQKVNPNTPDVDINFTIYPNTLQYFELNVVSGWMYVTSPYPSRGIIIYRYSLDEFKAYERKPANHPDQCGTSNRLFVDFPYVRDTCVNYKYSILDGGIIEGGDGYPLIQYHTSYDGNALRVYN